MHFAFRPNSYLFVHGTEIIIFKAKHSEIVATTLCLRNISKEFSEKNMKKTRLYKYVYDLSVNHHVHAVTNILHIYKYLVKKNGEI